MLTPDETTGARSAVPGDRQVALRFAHLTRDFWRGETARCAWLWTLLIAGQPGAAYNMGSEDAISIADLAHRIDALLGGGGVEILGKPDPGWNAGRYVPSTALIRRELGVAPTVDLDEAIRRTAIWNGWKS